MKILSIFINIILAILIPPILYSLFMSEFNIDEWLYTGLDFLHYGLIILLFYYIFKYFKYNIWSIYIYPVILTIIMIVSSENGATLVSLDYWLKEESIAFTLSYLILMFIIYLLDKFIFLKKVGSP